MSFDVPDGITTAGQKPIMAYQHEYGGLSWLQRKLGDPEPNQARADRPIMVNGEKRYVAPEDLRALQDDLVNGKKIYIEGKEVTDLDLNPGGKNSLHVNTYEGPTRYTKGVSDA